MVPNYSRYKIAEAIIGIKLRIISLIIVILFK